VNPTPESASVAMPHERHGGTYPTRCRGCQQPWPCPEAEADFLPLKPYTKYVCPNDGGGLGHSSMWSGALVPQGRTRSDGWCIGGAQMVEESAAHPDIYRLTWENVRLGELWRYSNADPALFKNTTQIVPNSQIPDEHWQETSKETNNPWDQYQRLRSWADADTGFVRNVRLERQVTEPRWEPVEPPTKADLGATP
jgi:hypothetical protein